MGEIKGQGKVMKAAIFRGARRVEVVEVPVPEVGADEVLVRVHYCGICGSDLEAYHTGMYEPNIIIGHEFAGDVVAVGEGVDSWAVGDRVTVSNVIPCGHCPYCLREQPTLCESLLVPGITLNGGMAEHAVLPARALLRLPDGVSIRQGALVEPLAVALHGVRRSALRSGDRVLVMGAGTIGLLTAQCALLAGAGEVYLSEIDPNRVALAKQWNASAVFDPQRQNLAVELSSRTGGEGPAVVYICTGAPPALEDAVTLVGKGGQIVVLGLVVEPMAADFLTLVLNELDIRGSYLGYEEFPAALKCVAQRRIDVEKLISHEIGLADIVVQGFERLERPGTGAVKVLVKLIS
ncbi:MAG: alcohol dehydrogenase catalytic domain-containing protein [Proteobacteria bacterium]|nr:alcohol dehydrogenase catalytic domain-containing protein [Pseudomonadota bacterium]NIS67726.1 alcohol dehydrogenase catalytic domain-containing protein [Pseudomonadota bacterium]